MLAYDEVTGEQAYKKVVKLFRNETKEWYHINVNGEEIVCTGGHPFYVASLDKFIPARELKLGDTLLLSNNACVTIGEIKVEKLERAETTYNFEVEDYHTYYVSESKVLVHNACTNPEVEIQLADENDFTDEAWKKAQSLAKDANGNTVSSRSVGQEIHKGFMPGQSESVIGGGPKGGYGYFDGFDQAKNIVYELKPNNPASIKRGIAQLQRYQRALIADGRQASKLVLVLY